MAKMSRSWDPGPALRRRDALKFLAACLADFWLPRRVFAQRPARSRKPERRVIVVTFGGGVRYEDTLAPGGWVNIPHLANEIVPQGLVYPVARYDGITGHFNSTGALVTGCRQERQRVAAAERGSRVPQTRQSQSSRILDRGGFKTPWSG